jgi:prepilin-type N-terminal cleavage/methylation domain-containing protein
MRKNIAACLRDRLEGYHGFTLVELLVGLVISSFLLIGIYRIFNTSQNSQAIGLDLSEAQQNARTALATLEKDLRLVGCGIPTHVQSPILVASEYRITFVNDRNGNQAVDLGETITYFLDPSTSNFIAATTPNPKDMVLRRVVSDSLNPNAAPVIGWGEIIASGITQQTDNDGTLDVPMFQYFDDQGTLLIDLGAYDPSSAAYGYTVSDSAALGRPPGGANEVAVMTIGINIVAESEARDEFLDDYQRVTLSTLVAPRNLPLNLRWPR